MIEQLLMDLIKNYCRAELKPKNGEWPSANRLVLFAHL